MKFLVPLAFAFSLTLFAAKSTSPSDAADVKHLYSTLPSGYSVGFSALNIDRTLATSTTHLTGNVRVVIRQTVKAGDQFIVVCADEAIYNSKTGELVPTGHVKITQETL